MECYKRPGRRSFSFGINQRTVDCRQIMNQSLTMNSKIQVMCFQFTNNVVVAAGATVGIFKIAIFTFSMLCSIMHLSSCKCFLLTCFMALAMSGFMIGYSYLDYQGLIGITPYVLGIMVITSTTYIFPWDKLYRGEMMPLAAPENQMTDL